jgi:hypothetical protein
MTVLRSVGLGVLLAAVGLAAAHGQGKGPQVSEKDFRRAHLRLLEDPLGKSAKEDAKVIMLFAMQTPRAAVVLRKEEMNWFGKDEKRGLLLLAAYAAGNTESQLNSGVKRNDRYAGLLSLFRVYRLLRQQDGSFKNAEVEQLLKLHGEDRLLKYVLELEQKAPTKLSPEDEKALEKVPKK